MRLVSYLEKKVPRLGAVVGDKVIDLKAVDKRIPASLGEFLRGGGKLSTLKTAVKNAKAKATRPLAGLNYDLVLPTPGKILCLGLNYMEHVKEGSNKATDYPTIFMRGRSSLLAHGKPIMRAPISDKLDYEAELAVIIGKSAKNVAVADAYKHIAGYTCFNDATFRDYQRITTQWTVGKNFDQTGGFGPFFVTPDEVPMGGKGLKIQSRLNGQVMQSDNTSNMMHPVAETISLLSKAMTLEPGDVIMTGTPSGVGYPRTPPVFMKDGDVIEVEIEGVGLLRNPVKDA